ncbi:MAG TPA: hypothetical protein VF447_06445, partial [Terriglobales bacterium]
HLEVATTDSDGRYHIPAWNRRPVTDSEGGFFGLRNIELSRRTYKQGYVQYKYDPRDTTTILMTAFKGSAEERIEYLRLQGTRGCGKNDASRIHELSLWRAICQEARALPEAKHPQADSHSETFLHNIDRHLTEIKQDLDQASAAIPSNRCAGG